MKRSGPLKRTPLTRGKRLASVSRKQARRASRYAKVKAEVLDRDGNTCQRQSCGKPAGDVQHMKGRVGEDLYDKRYLITLCRACHDWAESHRIAAIAEGLAVRRLS